MGHIKCTHDQRISSQELGVESQTIKHPAPTPLYKTMQKRKSMNVNPPSIARSRTASRLELSNNPRRAPCKTTGFCTPDVGPLRTMHNVSHNAATTSMVTERKPLVQNSKIPERQTIVRQEPATTGTKPALPPPPRAAQNPGGESCAVRHFPQNGFAQKRIVVTVSDSTHTGNVGFNLLDFGVFRRIFCNTAGQMALEFLTVPRCDGR